MRFIVVAVILLASSAQADVLGLKFGMTAAQVKAAKPCKAPTMNAAKASLICKGVPFAGAKMDAELWVPTKGLSRVGLTMRIGPARKDAEAAADALVDHLAADYGPLEMVGVGEIKASAALFDNADKTFARMKGKLKAASMFSAKHVPDGSMTVFGKVIRDRVGYAFELSFVP
jgi:hypothetical protein